MYEYKRLVASVLIAMGLIAPHAALSQSSEDSENQYGLEEIIVTARKIGESIQDIPVSVQAFSSDAISKQQIVNVEDLVKFTPGVVSTNQQGSRRNSAIAFRGIASNGTERQKQTSSAFLDGIYLSGSSQWVGMNDIERVEMVKGPQSAFFGRATYSGAINYISKTPGNEWGFDVQTIFGDNGRADVWLAAEGPIIEDKLAFRVSGRYYTYDGAWDNSPPPGGGFPGQEFGDIGARETEAFNVTLNWTPTDDIAIKFRYLQNDDDDGPSTAFIIQGENNNCGPFDPTVPRAASYYCGTLSSDLITDGVTIDTAPLGDTSLASDLGYELEATFMSLNAEWDIGGSGYTLTSVTGSYNEKTRDYRGQIRNELDNFVRWEDESFSQELRFASPQDQRLRWMVGAYYLDLEYYKGGSEAGFPSPGPQGPFSFFGEPRGAPIVIFPLSAVPSESIENKAIFASVGFDFTEKLSLSVELRQEEEDIVVDGTVIQEAMPLDSSTDELAITTAQPFGGAEVATAASFDATLPRVILDYQWTDNTMIYGSYSEGNNPGGFNPEVLQMEPTVAAPAFAAEFGIGPSIKQAKLVSYEFGVKHSLADGRGFLNGAVYLMEQTNQRFRNFIVGVDSNGDGRYVAPDPVLGQSDRIGQQVDFEANGSTDLWGLELLGSYALNENWLVSAGYNYMKTDILVYEDDLNRRVLGDASAAGLETARTPEHTGNIAVDFNTSAGSMLGQEDGEWFGRWDAWYQSEAYTWTVNLAKSEAAWMHNLRGGWRNDKYSVTVWVENLLDDDPVLSAERTTGSFLTGALGYHLTLPEPRTYGVTFTAHFGD
jgi:iron complex outermembrane receptor protein